MLVFQCPTPGCDGSVVFACDGREIGQVAVDQLTRQRLDTSEDQAAECRVCHVIWQKAELLRRGAGAAGGPDR